MSPDADRRAADSRGRGPGRGPRADAVRNRHKVVQAAHRVFSRRGPDVSMREVAKAAGVGLGTIYRHFPDKESLLAGVVEDRFRGLAEQTRATMASLPPWGAFVATMRRMAEMMTEDRAFAGAIGAARAPVPGSDPPADQSEACRRRDLARGELDEVLGDVATAAQAAGELRSDVGPPEFGLVLGGVAMALSHPTAADRPPAWDRYLTVVLDGLRERSRGASDDEVDAVLDAAEHERVAGPQALDGGVER